MWKESYRLGVEQIDVQHKKLFDMVENLLEIIVNSEPDKMKEESVKAIAFLKEYVIKHFHDEEIYQESINYSLREEHKLLHKRFTEEVLRQEKMLVESDFGYNELSRFAGVLSTWLIYHVADADQKIVSDGKTVKKDASTSLLSCLSDSAQDVFKKIAGIDVEEDANKQSSGIDKGICVEVGIIGEKEGKASITYSDVFTYNLIKTMTGMVSEKLDEMAISIVKEVSNIIAGTFATKLSENNIICDIKTPVYSLELGNDYDNAVSFSTESGDAMVQLELA